MTGLWAGVAGFFIAILTDFLSAGRLKNFARVGFWIFVIFLTYALYDTALRADKFNISGALILIGWVLLPITSGLLIYSLFIELPFLSTYTGDSQHEGLINK